VRPSSLEVVEKLVRGRGGAMVVSGVVSAVRSALADEPSELLGNELSELLFLVMLRARTGPRVAVL
jgi:hypothetical protein